MRAIGSCDVEAATLFSYDNTNIVDIKFLIANVSISESINRTNMSVYIDVLDTQGILNHFPIVGEETLFLEINDAYTNTTTKLELSVVAVTNIKILEKNDGLSYRLELISKTSFKSKLRRVLASFEKPTFEIVIDIFNQTFENIVQNSDTVEFSDRLREEMRNIIGTSGEFGTSEYTIFNIPDGRSFTVEKTDAEVRCLIPNYTPEQAMMYLASISLNQTSSPSCSFKFFETKSGYFFVTDEFLIRQATQEENESRIKPLHYSSTTSRNPEAFEIQANKLKSISVLRYADTMADLYSGAYNTRIVSLDVLYGIAENLRFNNENAKDTFSGIDVNAKEKHSDSFIENIFIEENERVLTFVKNYDTYGNIQIKGDQFIPEISLNRSSYSHRMNSTVLSAVIDGRLDISAGDVVYLNLNEMTSAEEREKDTKFSGRYLVSDVENNIKGKTLETKMKLIKYGWED